MAYCENRTDEHAVVLAERLIVGGGKRVREFLFIALVLLQALASKGEAANQPHQALSRSSFLLALFVLYQLFEGAGESGCGIISIADFLFHEMGRL